MNTAKIRDALMTTAAVLATIYVLNMTPAKPLIGKALGYSA